jgi:hypothetical protein
MLSGCKLLVVQLHFRDPLHVHVQSCRSAAADWFIGSKGALLQCELIKNVDQRSAAAAYVA